MRPRAATATARLSRTSACAAWIGNSDESAIRRLIAAHGLAAFTDSLLPYSSIQIQLSLVPAPDAPVTRIGGVPELPADFARPCHRWPLAEVRTWPEWSRRDVAIAQAAGECREEGEELVMPLQFLAQIACREVDTAIAMATGAAPPIRSPQARYAIFASTSTNQPDARFGKRMAARVVFVGELRPARPPPCSDEPVSALPLRPVRTLRCWLPWEDRQRLAVSDAQRDELAKLRAVDDALVPFGIDG